MGKILGIDGSYLPDPSSLGAMGGDEELETGHNIHWEGFWGLTERRGWGGLVCVYLRDNLEGYFLQTSNSHYYSLECLKCCLLYN